MRSRSVGDGDRRPRECVRKMLYVLRPGIITETATVRAMTLREIEKYRLIDMKIGVFRC